MKLFFIIILFVVRGSVNSQTVTEGKYWFDNDISNAQPLSGNYGGDVHINTQIDVGPLTSGIHIVNLIFKQSDGKWSSIISQTFYCIKGDGVGEYEFWFDKDYIHKTSVQRVVTNDLIIPLTNLDAQSLKNGFHQFNIRFKPNGGLWSSVQSEMFFKKGNGLQPLGSVQQLRYWLNNDNENAKPIEIGILTNETLSQLLENEEDLIEGKYQLCFQIRDNANLWSPVVCDSFTKTPNEYTLKIYPKININKNNYNIGESLQINGYQFTQNSQIKIQLKNSYGQIVHEYNDISADVEGKINLTLPLLSTFKRDQYFINAIDITKLKPSNISTFNFNSELSNKITITYPNNQSKVKVNETLNITWKQKADFEESVYFPNSNYIQKTYKLEYSNDAGITWNFLRNYINTKSILGNENSYSSLFVPQNVGIFLFKITDLNNNSNFTISDPFEASYSSPEEVYTTFQWDKSSPVPDVNAPIGLAADSTSKILIKLNKKITNTHTISSISAQIESVENLDIPQNSTRLLGRISFAQTPNSYTLEADNIPAGNISYANSTAMNYPNNQGVPINNETLYFWYCAPIDFTNNINDYSGIRKVRVKFIVSYLNNEHPPETHYSNNIEIVRPPLMFVHGLNSDHTAFEETRFNIGNSGDIKYSDPAQSIWKKIKFVDLDPGGSYEKNAKILLDQYQNQSDEYYNNSFQDIILSMHNNGYAVNRVDYVGHSMGGCVARKAISLPGYIPSESSTHLFKNYNRGFINKLITINTPHNGSPLADLIDYLVNEVNSISVSDLVSWGGLGKILLRELFAIAEASPGFEMPSRLPFIQGIVIKDNTSSLFPKYVASDAIRNLRANDSRGQKLIETNVKNHLIAGQLFKNPDFTNFKINFGGFFELQNNKLSEYLDLLQKIIDYSKNVNLFTNNPAFKAIVKEGKDKLQVFEIVNIIFATFQAYNFVLKSDLVVPLDSQLPDLQSNPPVDISANQKLPGNRSVSYGISANHISITNQLAVGNRIIHLLNSSLMDENYFRSTIPENNGSVYLKNNQKRTTTTNDTTIYRLGTTRIQIHSPGNNSTTVIDSILTLKIKILDTNHLKQVMIIYQNSVYNTISKDSIIFFKIKNKPIDIGPTNILAIAVYDSLNYTLKYFDGITVNTIPSSIINSISVKPKSYVINPGQEFRIPITANINLQMATIGYENPLLIKYVLDTNVLSYDTLIKKFIAKSGGNTRIVFDYLGSKDTAYIYISQRNTLVALPIKLTSFEFDLEGCNKIIIKWQTAQEINNSGFEIEQSTNGSPFKKIGFVAGAGNSDIPKNYEFNVLLPEDGNYFFRLKQIDIDGKFTYSKVLSFKSNCLNQQLTILPNPAQNQITISGLDNTKPHDYEIYDSKGSLLKTLNRLQGNMINIKELPNGIYVLKIDNINTIRFIKQ